MAIFNSFLYVHQRVSTLFKPIIFSDVVARSLLAIRFRKYMRHGQNMVYDGIWGMVIPQYWDSNCQGKLMGSVWYTDYYQLLGWFSWGDPLLICQWRKDICHFRNLEVPNTSRNFREYPHRRCSGIWYEYIYIWQPGVVLKFRLIYGVSNGYSML